MNTYVPIEAILNFIPKGIQEEDTKIQLLSYAMQGLRTLNIYQKYEYVNCIKWFDGHQLLLPEDVKDALSVRYMYNIDEYYSCNKECATNIQYKCGCNNDCSCEYSNTTVTEYPDGSTTTKTENRPVNSMFINHELYANSYEGYSKPMKYVGNFNSLCSKCNDRYNKCDDYYSIDSSRVLRTNIESGYLCIEYNRIPLDEDDNILIIDDVDIMNALARYAMAMHWMSRMHRKEQGSMNIYNNTLSEATMLMMKARGKFNLRSIDIIKLNHLFLGRNQYLKTNSVTNESGQHKELSSLYNKYRSRIS